MWEKNIYMAKSRRKLKQGRLDRSLEIGNNNLVMRSRIISNTTPYSIAYLIIDQSLKPLGYVS